MPTHRTEKGAESTLALAQGAYYVITGVWPFVSMPAFEAVTGTKKEWWLVKTVGAVVAVIGATLLAAGSRGEVSRDLRWIAVGSATGLGGISAYYAAKGRISPIYFADAAAEAALIGGWWLAGRRRPAPPVPEAERGGTLVEEQSEEIRLEERTALP